MDLLNRTVVRGKAHYWIKDAPTQDHEAFWSAFQEGSWEPELEEVLSTALSGNGTMIDLGAWIGPVSIIASRMCTRVHAFEPDPVAYELLVGTACRQRRKNIRTYQLAVSDSPGPMKIGCKDGGTFGDSMTSPWYTSGDTVTVDTVTVSTMIDMIGLDSASLRLVKVDIEGGEEAIIGHLVKELRVYGASILLSTHGLLCQDDEHRACYIQRVQEAISGCEVQRVCGTWEGLGTLLVTPL